MTFGQVQRGHLLGNLRSVFSFIYLFSFDLFLMELWRNNLRGKRGALAKYFDLLFREACQHRFLLLGSLLKKA